MLTSAAVTGGAVKAAAGIIPVLGRKLATKAQVKRISDSAASLLPSGALDKFVGTLNEDQNHRLQKYIDSPEFANLMLQSVIFTITGASEESVGLLRDQVRPSLKRSDIFTEADLTQAADVIIELLLSSALAVQRTSRLGLDNRYAAAIAGRVATSAARNSEIMELLQAQGDIWSVVAKLKSQVRSMHLKLILPTIVDNQRVPWDQLYVPPLLRLIDSSGVSIAGSEPGSIREILKRTLRMVVLGDPGAGKSTLAEKLAFDLAREVHPEFKGMVPLRVVARKHAVGGATATVLDYLVASCASPYQVSVSSEQIEYLLLNGRAVVIVDGLDELGDNVSRSDFVQKLEAFSHLYPLARIVVTSRQVGYDEAPLDDEQFIRSKIDPFDDHQVEVFVRKWFKVSRQESGLADSFLTESKRVADLRSSPLILTLLCTLYVNEHAIPENRPEIYARCADLLFEKWDASRGIDLAPALRPFLKRVVQRLAWKIFTDPAGRQQLPRTELVDFLAAEVLADRYNSTDEARVASEAFVEFCAGRSWVLTEAGSSRTEKLYGFTHKTFLEYFAAVHLVGEHGTASAVWDALRSNLTDSRWDVAAELVVQIFDKNHNDGADRVLRLLIGEAETPQPLRLRSSWLAFAVRCLTACTPSTDIIRQIATSCVRLSVSRDMADRMDPANHPGKDDTGLGDAPFLALLSVSLPGNTLRVVRATAAELDISSESVSEETAGFLWSAIDLYAGEAWGDEINKRVSSERSAAARWARLTSGIPTEGDIAALGIKSLFSLARVGNFYQGLAAVRIVNRALTGPILEVVGELEEMYRAVAKLDLPRSKPPIYAVRATPWQPHQWRNFQHFSAEAKGALLLLVVGLLRAGHSIDAEEIDDARVRSVLLARRQKPLEMAATDAINSWGLPEAAHGQLVNWVVHEKAEGDAGGVLGPRRLNT